MGKRGGAQPGAGRPRTGKKAFFTAITISIPVEYREKWEQAVKISGLSKAKFIQKYVDEVLSSAK